MAQATREDIAEFERSRNQLLSISGQKQQLQFQSKALAEAIEELEKTTEKKVHKIVGNILVQVPTEKVKEEMKKQKESADLMVGSLQKQEDITIAKLNKLKNRIEGREEEEAETKKKGK